MYVNIQKLWSDPVAAAVSGLGKVTNYLQDRVLPNLMLDDFDQLTIEQQRYAMKSLMDLKKGDEECENLRVHQSADGFQVVQVWGWKSIIFIDYFSNFFSLFFTTVCLARQAFHPTRKSCHFGRVEQSPK